MENVNSLCTMQPDGPSFVITPSCDPFNPYDSKCFSRLPNNPHRTCYFCCNQEAENGSFQRCSDIRYVKLMSLRVTFYFFRAGEKPTYPLGWMDTEISGRFKKIHYSILSVYPHRSPAT